MPLNEQIASSAIFSTDFFCSLETDYNMPVFCVRVADALSFLVIWEMGLCIEEDVLGWTAEWAIRSIHSTHIKAYYVDNDANFRTIFRTVVDLKEIKPL